MHQVSVIGGSVVDESICSIARRLGNLLASKGYIIFNGGLGGVMECVSKGVQEAGGIVIGIIPSNTHMDGNRYLTAKIPTGMGFARNFLVVRAGEVVVAIDGSTGTLSEASFALAEGKTVIAIGEICAEPKKPNEGKMIRVNSPEEAVLAVEEYFKNHDSTNKQND